MQHLKNARNRDGRVDTRRAAGQEVWGTRSSNRAVWHFPDAMSLGRPCLVAQMNMHSLTTRIHDRVAYEDSLNGPAEVLL
jgi:hypothetical protein